MSDRNPFVAAALFGVGVVSATLVIAVLAIQRNEISMRKELAQLKEDNAVIMEILGVAHADLKQINPTPTLMQATWYGHYPKGRRTASGDKFDIDGLTCAHRTLPFGTLLLLEHRGRKVVVRVNDRGPELWTGKEIDITRRAAEILGFKSDGTATILVRRLT